MSCSSPVGSGYQCATRIRDSTESEKLLTPYFSWIRTFESIVIGLAGRSDKLTQANPQSSGRVIASTETTCKGIYSKVSKRPKQIIYIKSRTNDSASVGCPSWSEHERLRMGIVYIGKCSALVDQFVLRVWLFEIVNPRGKVGIGISCQVAKDEVELV